MSDTRQSEFAPRRPPIALITILVGIALLVGVALMIYAVRSSGGWFVRPAAAPAQAQAGSDYNPEQPRTGPPPPTAAAAAIDPVTLATRESVLSGQLAALEARTATVAVDAAGAASQAGRAESILVAFAARRAVDRGVPLGYLEEQLRQRFGTVQPAATLAIIRSARQPLTLEGLRRGLDANSDDLLTGGDGGGLLAGLGRELRNLVVIHDADTPSPIPADRLARARRMLDAGQIEAALAEVRRLPGAAKSGAWIAAARRYGDTRRALDLIESAAILGRASAAPVPPG